MPRYNLNIITHSVVLSQLYILYPKLNPKDKNLVYCAVCAVVVV